jgi:hypothetical protein
MVHSPSDTPGYDTGVVIAVSAIEHAYRENFRSGSQSTDPEVVVGPPRDQGGDRCAVPYRVGQAVNGPAHQVDARKDLPGEVGMGSVDPGVEYGDPDSGS